MSYQEHKSLLLVVDLAVKHYSVRKLWYPNDDFQEIKVLVLMTILEVASINPFHTDACGYVVVCSTYPIASFLSAVRLGESRNRHLLWRTRGEFTSFFNMQQKRGLFTVLSHFLQHQVSFAIIHDSITVCFFMFIIMFWMYVQFQ